MIPGYSMTHVPQYEPLTDADWPVKGYLQSRCIPFFHGRHGLNFILFILGRAVYAVFLFTVKNANNFV